MPITYFINLQTSPDKNTLNSGIDIISILWLIFLCLSLAKPMIVAFNLPDSQYIIAWYSALL